MSNSVVVSKTGSAYPDPNSTFRNMETTMAHAAHFSARISRGFGLGSFFKRLLGAQATQHVPHWTEYLRDSHRV